MPGSSLWEGILREDAPRCEVASPGVAGISRWEGLLREDAPQREVLRVRCEPAGWVAGRMGRVALVGRWWAGGGRSACSGAVSSRVGRLGGVSLPAGPVRYGAGVYKLLFATVLRRIPAETAHTLGFWLIRSCSAVPLLRVLVRA